eukprot:1156176-Pelagomonas_calceolata.AAC.3
MRRSSKLRHLCSRLLCGTCTGRGNTGSRSVGGGGEAAARVSATSSGGGSEGGGEGAAGICVSSGGAGHHVGGGGVVGGAVRGAKSVPPWDRQGRAVEHAAAAAAPSSTCVCL